MKEANFCVVALDETGDWPKDWRIWEYADKIFGIYFFDSQRATHCCELTPSYELHFIDTVVQWKEGDIFDAEHYGDVVEEWREKIDEVDCDRATPTYFHCNYIDSLRETVFSDTGCQRFVSVGQFNYEDDEEAYEELFNERFDNARCNSVM